MSRRRLTDQQRRRIAGNQAKTTAAAVADHSETGETGEGPWCTGQVISHFGVFAIVEAADGGLHRCRLRQNLGTAVCGDAVQWQQPPTGDGVIGAVAPRRNLLTRPDYSGHPKAVAANIDQILVVAAPLPALNEGLLDRYFVAIRALGAQARLLINKCDLLDAAGRDALTHQVAPYAALATVHFVSLRGGTADQEPLDTLLQRLLHDQISLLVGQSGVGKSSLVQRLLPDKDIRTAAVSLATGKGTHTTTSSTLYHLPFGGDLIDSPGVRSFELGDIAAHQVQDGFPDVTTAAAHCRFANCRHRQEPGCAVQAAIGAGQLQARRLQSYHQLLDERAAHQQRY